MGPPPELHHNFVTMHKDFPKLSAPELEACIELLLNDIEDVELTLKKAELQLKNKDLDQLYYNQLVNKTETEIGLCATEIQKLK